MKCPSRVTKDGDFKDCYGEDCAYSRKTGLFDSVILCSKDNGQTDNALRAIANSIFRLSENEDCSGNLTDAIYSIAKAFNSTIPDVFGSKLMGDFLDNMSHLTAETDMDRVADAIEKLAETIKIK